jgi:hypothetical protein
VAGCEVLALEDALRAPVTHSDRAADELREQRLQALKRGEIPT